MISKAQLQYKVSEKVLAAQFKNTKIFNIKLHQQSNNSTIDDYYDIKDSVEFYSMGVNV